MLDFDDHHTPITIAEYWSRYISGKKAPNQVFFDYAPKKSRAWVNNIEAGLTGKPYYRNENGYKEIETEMDLGWHIAVDKESMPILSETGNLYLISHSITEAFIEIAGTEGYNNYQSILQNAADCYKSTKLKGISTIPTREFFRQLHDSLKIRGVYFLADQYVTTVGGVPTFKVLYADGESIKIVKLFDDLGLSERFSGHIRPIVEIPLETMVLIEDIENDGSSKRKALKLGPCDPKRERDSENRKHLDFIVRWKPVQSDI